MILHVLSEAERASLLRPFGRCPFQIVFSPLPSRRRGGVLCVDTGAAASSPRGRLCSTCPYRSAGVAPPPPRVAGGLLGPRLHGAPPRVPSVPGAGEGRARPRAQALRAAPPAVSGAGPPLSVRRGWLGGSLSPPA